MKPILKWAGGKTQLLDILKKQMNLDEKYEKYKSMTYVEPFVGAGALFLDLIENDVFDTYVINDINSKLINLYKVIRDDVQELVNKLNILKDIFNSYQDNLEKKEELFYEIRDKFNSLQDKEYLEKENKIELASYFIFLNKTCFNGLYRENSHGKFNVPFGKYKRVNFFEESELIKLSNLLNKKDKDGNCIVHIMNKSYSDLECIIGENCFVYIDPPYRPVTLGGFTSYNKSSFNDKNQIELSKFYNNLDEKGAKLMLSNSDPKILNENDNFFDDLYSRFNINRVFAKRSINSKGNGRGLITELLISNYK